VMVVTPEKHIEVRKIKLGLETADRVEVRSGLQDGDLVVIGNRGGLQPGQAVEPKIVKVGEAS
jgi:multidrug efflux pump subunit AcrA (membrane-fusion protein)